MKKKTAIGIVVFLVFVTVWSIVTYQEYYSAISHPTNANINMVAFKEAYGRLQEEYHNCRGPEDVYNKCVEDFVNKRVDSRVGIYENASDNILNLFIFNDVCNQYIELQVIEEVDKCLSVYQAFNEHMDQLKQLHNETFTKNVILGNETGSREEPIPIQ